MARVIVIGGGIGGLTTAIALRRKGWEVSVYETSPELRPVGKGIWMPFNAMQVLERLGLAADVAEKGWPLQCIEMRTASGKLLSTLQLKEHADKYGYSIISIRRADLIYILANVLEPGVLRLGKQFTHFTEESNLVRVYFKDGSEDTADLLIGADGIHSRVREQLFPEVSLRYSGQTCFRGISEFALPEALASTCREIWGGRNRFGFSAVGPRHVYWFAPQLSPQGLEDPLDSRITRLVDSFERFPSPIPEMLAATKAHETIRTDLFDFPPLSSWSRHNVVLVGDAAHAMTPNLGQGGAQAIEDAFVLAEQSEKTKSITQAIQSYERIRMPRVKWIVETARTLGRISHWQNPLATWLRDSAIQWTPSSVTDRQLEKLYRLDYFGQTKLAK